MSPTSATTKSVSTSGSPQSGDVTYTASGLTPNSTVNISLFACSGANAPTTSSSGTTTFTPPTTTSSTGTTSPTAGNAQGEGVTDTGEAYIASVNGAPETTNQDPTTSTYPTPAKPNMLTGIGTGTAGTVSFVVNSFTPDCAIPVVYAPSSSSPNNLQVGANGQPTNSFGEGGSTTYNAATAATASYSNVYVESVNQAAGTFQGEVLGSTGTASGATLTPETGYGQVYTFTYTTSGSSYEYDNPTVPLTEAQFASYLSGQTTSVAPNTGTTSAPASTTVPGDILGTVAYNAAGPSQFNYSADVPAAPTGLTATYSPATTSPVASQKVTLNWTATPNPDVASYDVYRATQTTSNGTTTTSGYQPIATGVTGTTYTDYGSAVTAAASSDTGTTNGGPTTRRLRPLPRTPTW